MTNYTLNVLRNHTVYPSKDAAIEALNLFEHHSYGQPLTLLYLDDTHSQRVMFVVGIKNASEQTGIKCGPDFYEIINDFSSIKGEVDWSTYLGEDIIKTDTPLNTVYISISDFSVILRDWNEKYTAFEDYVFFVQDRDKGMIYRGNIPYSDNGGGSYVLPIASSDTLGGVKIGENLTIDEYGTLKAHAEGHRYDPTYDSLAEGVNENFGSLPIASGNRSHAEGMSTRAMAASSHAEGIDTWAIGEGSHAEGTGTVAASNNQHVCGEFNIADSNNEYAVIVGNGMNDENRSNSFAIKKDGTIVLWNNGTPVELTPAKLVALLALLQ